MFLRRTRERSLTHPRALRARPRACGDAPRGAQRSFCLAHCELFEDTDENKLEYTPVFEEYCETMEALIADRLAEAIEDFDMVEFMEMLQEQQESQGGNCEGGPSMQGDVFEMLHELGDFASFKELMLAFKAEGGGDGAGVSHGLDGPQAARPGGGAAAFGLGISVMSLEPSG